jgi:hypothetical protein
VNKKLVHRIYRKWGIHRKEFYRDHYRSMRWYNPTLEDFEWREVPHSDEEALSVLDGSTYTPTCTRIYREWRGLGAGIMEALIRAGEAAKKKSHG